MAGIKRTSTSTPNAGALLAAAVDELGELEKQLAPLKPKIARAEQLRKAIRAHYETSPAAQPFEAKGERFVVLVGPRALERKINFAALAKKIGLKAFAAFATCTLAALEEHVTTSVITEVVTQDNTGARSLKTFERGTAA